MKNYFVSDQQLNSIASAICAKGNISEGLEFPEGFVNAINNLSVGNGENKISVPRKEVNFYDYDGTIVYSYTAEEFIELTSMPANPNHSNDAIPLTAQGWNWTLADAKAYVEAYGFLDIGQMYKTTDEKTHILMHIYPGYMRPVLTIMADSSIEVDWGDGEYSFWNIGDEGDIKSATKSINYEYVQLLHDYAESGDYDITLSCAGTICFPSGEDICSLFKHEKEINNERSSNLARRIPYINGILQIYLSNNINYINEQAFYNCPNLTSITIPNNVVHIDQMAFGNCFHLTSITIPNNVVSIDDSVFSHCSNLTSITIPKSVQQIGAYAFDSCISLISIALPDGIQIIENSTFSYCISLTRITIPNSVESIGSEAFLDCNLLIYIYIPDSVTSIHSYAFDNCYNILECVMDPAVPPEIPSVEDGGLFPEITNDCIIYVPENSLEAYKTAEVWSNYAAYMQPFSEYSPAPPETPPEEEESR